MQKCSICNNYFTKRKTESRPNYLRRKFCSTICSNSINKRVFDNLLGKQFGKLKVIKFSHRNSSVFWECECSCGNRTVLPAHKITSGKTKSCGCLVAETIRKNMKTHGMSKTRFYTIWNAMRMRCYNKNGHNYKYYGGKGISVDKKWNKFTGFFDDMYEPYQEHVTKYREKNTTIDRIDNNLNYCKSNCKWSTLKEQANNKG